MIRVFPQKTSCTPDDDLAFYGNLPLFLPPDQPVKISVTFTWDISEGKRLFEMWSQYYSDIEIGGPAFDDPGGEFFTGRFLKPGFTITSRGCPRKCPWCFVPKREGLLRELPIKDGWLINDNNLLACSEQHIEQVFEMLSCQPNPAKFVGGLDPRLFNKHHVNLLKYIRFSELWFSCDTPSMVNYLYRVAELIPDIEPRKRRCYVLVGYNQETIRGAEKRLEKIYKLGFWPFAMVYRDKNLSRAVSKDWSKIQKRWQRPAAFKTHMKQIMRSQIC